MAIGFLCPDRLVLSVLLASTHWLSSRLFSRQSVVEKSRAMRQGLAHREEQS